MLTWNQRAVNVMLKAGKKGSIVNIASIAGFRGFTSGTLIIFSLIPGSILLIGLVQVLHTRYLSTACSAYHVLELGNVNPAVFYASKGIRCNAIAAGAMKTNIANEFAQGGLNMEGYMTMRKTCTYHCPERVKYR